MPGQITRFSRFSTLPLALLCLVAVDVARAQDTTILPQAQVGKPYSISIGVDTENGKGQLTWKLAQGELPSGLQLSITGKIEGTPTDAKSAPYVFDLSVSDSSQPPQSAMLHFSIAILPAPLRIKAVNVATTQLKVVGVKAVEVTPNAASPAGMSSLTASMDSSVADPPPASSNAKPAMNAANTIAKPPAVATNAPGPPPGSKPASAPDSRKAPASPEGSPGASNGNSQGSCVSTTSPTVPDIPVAGYKSVSGCAGTKNPMVEVTVYASGKVASCANVDASDTANKPVQSQRATVDNTTGVFSASFKDALKENEIVCVREVDADNKLNVGLASPLIVPKWTNEPSDSERGRTRYYFAAGVALSQDNQQFSNQDVYVDFNLERNWYRTAHSFLNSDFSAQLTSIPTAVTGNTTSTGNTTTGTTTTSTPTTSQTVSTFISSRKAAVVEGDFYLPLYAESFKWWYDGGSTLFVAPIIKGGLQSITSGALSISAPAPGTSTSSTTVNNTGLYYYWGAGIRLGDLKLHKSWNIGPEVLSHLDLTVGQWQNFRQCRSDSATPCKIMPDGTVSSGLYQPLLFGLQGQLNIPKTPVQIGFSSITPLKGGGQGDLRFFFGVKLDVGCIYKAFKAGQSPKFLDCTDDQAAATQAKAAAPVPKAP